MGIEYNQNNNKLLHTNDTCMHAWVLIAESCTCLMPKSLSLNPCYCLVYIFIRKSTSFCFRYIIPQTAIQSWIIFEHLAYLWRCIICNGSPWNPVEDNNDNSISSPRGCGWGGEVFPIWISGHVDFLTPVVWLKFCFLTPSPPFIFDFVIPLFDLTPSTLPILDEPPPPPPRIAIDIKHSIMRNGSMREVTQPKATQI